MISVTCLCLLVSFVFTFGPERANGSTKVDAYKVLNFTVDGRVYYVNTVADDIGSCVSLKRTSLDADSKTAKYDGVQIPPGTTLPTNFGLILTATDQPSIVRMTLNGDENLSSLREYTYTDYKTCLIEHSASVVTTPVPATTFKGCRMYALNGATPEEIAECKTHFVNCGKPIQVYNSACNDIKLP